MRDRGLRTWHGTPYPASRGRMEPPVGVARPRPAAPDERVRKERAAWEDTRIAQAYPPGTVSPDRRRAFEIPKGPLTAPAQTPRHTPHPGLLPVPVPPGRAPSPQPDSRNGLRTRPAQLHRARLSRACRPAAPTRSRAPTSSAPAAFVRNGRAPEPDCATSSSPRAARERAHPVPRAGQRICTKWIATVRHAFLFNTGFMARFWSLRGLSLRELAKRTFRKSWEDEVFGQSARLAFYFFFAMFPVLLLLDILLGSSRVLARFADLHC